VLSQLLLAHLQGRNDKWSVELPGFGPMKQATQSPAVTSCVAIRLASRLAGELDTYLACQSAVRCNFTMFSSSRSKQTGGAQPHAWRASLRFQRSPLQPKPA
jgi:hypothetical protein